MSFETAANALERSERMFPASAQAAAACLIASAKIEGGDESVKRKIFGSFPDAIA